jgi:hypothetical protein
MAKNATDFTVGRTVLYIPMHAYGDRNHPDVERGVVTSRNDRTVFVRFGSDNHSKGCYPDDLVYVEEEQ